MEPAVNRAKDRRAKIICTLGPASSSDGVITELLAAGMDCARLNMSHGADEDQRARLHAVRRASEKLGLPCAVMVDLGGTKPRVGVFKKPITLEEGRRYAFSSDGAGEPDIIPVDYPLHQDVRPGEAILLDDGALELRVDEIRGRTVTATVIRGGILASQKGINLPDTQVSAPSLTEQDRQHIAFGVAEGADFFALSFVRKPEDMIAAREEIRRCGGDVPVIAKIEKRQAVERLDEILAVSDGVMVARGDLGVELPPEEVPLVQKDIIVAANRRLVPVITATQMLESMVEHSRPTRAEASDVANAVWDGSDALMLSAETAVGRDPAGAVRMMDRIIRAAERQPGAFLSRVRSEHRTTEDTSGTISHAACTMAMVDPRVKAIVAFTRSGYTARLLSMDRPPVPILSISPDPAVRNRCALYWGTIAAISDESEGLLSMTITADEQARAVLGLREGDFIIIAGGWPRDLAATTNLLKVHRIGDPA